nr:hypothetical protein [Tanacetum cinerariifolium]
MGKPMEIGGGAEEVGLDLLFGDADDDDDEGPSSTTPGTLFPVGQPFLDMTHGNSVPPLVIDDLCVRMGNLEYEHGVLVKKMRTVSDAQVANGISIREIWPRVTTVEGQVQVMVSQAEQVCRDRRLAEMESLESTLMSDMLWMEERLAVLEKKLSRPSLGP